MKECGREKTLSDTIEAHLENLSILAWAVH